MIAIVLKTKKTGEFISCSATGHSGYAKPGFDIVCSAVSILLKSALKTLENSKLPVVSKSCGKGDLFFSVSFEGVTKDKYTQGGRRFVLVCVADFLKNGFEYIANEYSKNCKFSLQNVI